MTGAFGSSMGVIPSGLVVKIFKCLRNQ